MPRRLHGSSLALAITLALLLKALILFGLWKAFFSTPQAKHMRVPAAQVQQHFFAAQQQQQQTAPAPAPSVQARASPPPAVRRD
jgi:hypothetical protein